ncbi:uncharacterized protein LOC141632221 [Silene latifolia]|uniref:uncharacterized protein LOC141632221 n=1 Tax=Silene latifolia TaxID=37657 RepID=UPI003D7773B7
MSQMLLPAPRSALDSAPLPDLVDRAAEHSFESFQMALYLREKVSLLVAENAKLRKLAKEANEDRLKTQADLNKSQDLLLEEATQKQNLQNSLSLAEGRISSAEKKIAIFERKVVFEKEAADAKKEAADAKERAADAERLTSEVEKRASDAENRAAQIQEERVSEVQELKRTLVDALSYAALETKIDCIKMFQKGEHSAWDLGAEEGRLAATFPDGLNLDVLSGLVEPGTVPADDPGAEEEVNSPAPDAQTTASDAVEHIVVD